MSNSALRQAQLDSRHTSNQVWIGEQLFEEVKIFADQINLLAANVARTVASGTVGIATTGVATFSADQSAILAIGDYITVAGVRYDLVTGGNGTTVWQVNPPPSTAIAGGTAYIAYNALSYWDFPTVAMVGVRPIPELFRMRFGGTGTATAATFQFVRVNALTGVETPVTTAVATTSAAVWQGVDITPFGEEPDFESSSVINGVTQQNPVDEFLRLVCTAKTTLTTGRTLLVEMGLRRATGPNCFSATP